ncbi:MAG: alpha-E domain-containing protein, partial [Pseudohongiellaceae bacterium]
MLSSVAERVYWLGRYLERAENAARLLKVYSNMLFDLPRVSAHSQCDSAI